MRAGRFAQAGLLRERGFSQDHGRGRGSHRRDAEAAAMLLVVDPWHWLEPDGSLPTSNPRLRRQALRVARLIEYGAELEPGEVRLTLVECRRRPGGRPCPGFLAVGKFPDGELEAGCIACGEPDTRIHNWEDTIWALGVPPPVPSDAFGSPAD